MVTSGCHQPGANTDPTSQSNARTPTRGVIEVLAETHHPLTIVTKTRKHLPRHRPAGADGGEQAGHRLHLDLAARQRPYPHPSGAAPQRPRNACAVRELASAGIPPLCWWHRSFRSSTTSTSKRCLTRHTTRRLRGQLHHHPPAPRAESAVEGLADDALPGPCRARDGAHPRPSRRARKRQRIWRPHEGPGHLGRSYPPALPQSLHLAGLAHASQSIPTLDTSLFNPPSSDTRQGQLF